LLGRLGPTWRDQLVVQEEASQIVALAAGVRPGARVLDLCAAPGGKTIILSERLDGTGLLVAADHRAARIKLLHATMRRAGAAARLLSLDATQPLPFGPVFDVVLLDAPCSGLGVLRRDPDLKWSRQAADLVRFAEMQQQMLARAAAVVAPGGRLIYATCSSEPDENDAVVDQFLTAQPGFTPARPDFGGLVNEEETLVDSRGFLRTLPFTHGLDAFFGAVLARSTLLSA
jgi:16S rRNA (cytosine967-C5)-methyltransferase